ncbi:MAG TPA: cytochrome P450 [Candidatus Limnocylindria bacterium]|nr:cytochrome P450 [Candidatus Limnocylindria bacterium]
MAQVAPAQRSMLEFLIAQRRDPLGFLVRCVRESGDLVVFGLGPLRLVVLSDPSLIQEVLVVRSREFRKAHVMQAEVLPWGRRILGEGLLMSEGDRWLRHRRLMQQAFHRRVIAEYGRIMARRTAELVASWEPAVARDVHAEMKRLTLDTMTEVIFGGLAGAENADLGRALRDVFDFRTAGALTSAIPEWIPTPGNVRTGHGIRRLDSILYGLIAARRSTALDRTDLLSILISSRDEDGAGMSDQGIRDEIMSTLVAGLDTLGATLTYSLHTLALRPSIADRLADEFRSAASGHNAPVYDPSGLRYLDQFAREVLRLFPPGKSVVRTTVDECELGGQRFPAGTFVVMSQWVVQRDPRYFERPEEFDPERWSDDLAGRLPRFAYFPFGGGPRLCLGFAFADLMLRLATGVIVSRVQLAAHPDAKRTAWDPAQLRPRRGMWLVPRPRAA